MREAVKWHRAHRSRSGLPTARSHRRQSRPLGHRQIRSAASTGHAETFACRSPRSWPGFDEISCVTASGDVIQVGGRAFQSGAQRDQGGQLDLAGLFGEQRRHRGRGQPSRRQAHARRVKPRSDPLLFPRSALRGGLDRSTVNFRLRGLCLYCGQSTSGDRPIWLKRSVASPLFGYADRPVRATQQRRDTIP